MVIGFNKQFVQPILDGTKIHTIREDKHHRWKVCMQMHMATGVRTKKYKQFAKGTCTGTRRINIYPSEKKVSIIINSTEEKFFSKKGIETLAKNDGFASVEDFWEWFNKPFQGKLLYWTDIQY